MPDLSEPLVKAQTGEYSMGYLETLFKEETEALGKAFDASNDPEKGWLHAGDLLAGDTPDAKMDDYIRRGGALKAVADLFAKQDDAAKLGDPRNIRLPQQQQQQQKQFAPAPAGQMAEYAGGDTGDGLLKSLEVKQYQAMIASPEYADFTNRIKQGSGFAPGQVVGRTLAKDLIPVLKVQSFGADAQGLLGTDRIMMPYDMATMFLPYCRISTDPDTVIRFMKSRSPVDPNYATGEARGI